MAGRKPFDGGDKFAASPFDFDAVGFRLDEEIDRAVENGGDAMGLRLRRHALDHGQRPVRLGGVDAKQQAGDVAASSAA